MPKRLADGVEVGRRELCPCGSGERYGNCCRSPLFSFIRFPNGKIVAQRPITDKAMDVIEEARVEFQKTFGRKPGKNDKLFSATYLDPDSEILQFMLRVSEQSGKPQLAYAYQKTGLIITDKTYSKLSRRDKSEWNEAVDEYYELIECGIDPFTGLRSSVRDLFDHLDTFRSDCAIHFGSYVGRHRKNRHLEIHEFSQVLVLSRAQKILLLLKDKLGAFPQADALILIRSIFETYFVYQFLEIGRTSGLYFLARSSSKDGNSFKYKLKLSGKIDRSKIIFIQSGEEIPSHISFYSMAEMSPNISDRIIFDRIYSRLSDEVHFSYRNWEDYWLDDSVVKTSTTANPAEVASLFLLSVAMLCDCVSNSALQTKSVRRDAKFLFRRARQALLFLLGNLEEAPSDLFNDESLLVEIVNRLRHKESGEALPT